jgi:hypothetical protein
VRREGSDPSDPQRRAFAQPNDLRR